MESKYEKLLNENLNAKEMLKKRDIEISRLNSLYNVEQHIDNISEEYKVNKYIRQIDNLNKQLEFLNEENNKLTQNYLKMSKDLSFYSTSKKEIDLLTKKVITMEGNNSKLNKDLERCEKMNSRLNEQWNKSRKNIIIESSSEYYQSLSKTITEKELKIKEFTDKLK